MKIKILVIVVLLVLFFSFIVVLVVVMMVNGGIVYFKGEVVNVVCVVDAGFVDQIVQLGQVCIVLLVQEGVISFVVGFNIQLNDCDINVVFKVVVVFLGMVIDVGYINVLVLQSLVVGSVINVGVQILDRMGVVLMLDGVIFSLEIILNNGINIILFQVCYFATGVVILGVVNVDVIFKVQY